jgi:hypothetical protein
VKVRSGEGEEAKGGSDMWCLSIPGDPVWWQAIAGVAQALLAAAILLATRRYVKLTGSLVGLQSDVIVLQKQAAQRELYDRRVMIYDKTMAFLAKFAGSLTVEFGDIQQLYRDTREAEYLFEADVCKFITEVAEKASENRAMKAVHDTDQDRINRCNELDNWLASTAWEKAKDVFGHYLRIVEPAPRD